MATALFIKWIPAVLLALAACGQIPVATENETGTNPLQGVWCGQVEGEDHRISFKSTQDNGHFQIDWMVDNGESILLYKGHYDFDDSLVVVEIEVVEEDGLTTPFVDFINLDYVVEDEMLTMGDVQLISCNAGDLGLGP